MISLTNPKILFCNIFIITGCLSLRTDESIAREYCSLQAECDEWSGCDQGENVFINGMAERLGESNESSYCRIEECVDVMEGLLLDGQDRCHDARREYYFCLISTDDECSDSEQFSFRETYLYSEHAQDCHEKYQEESCGPWYLPTEYSTY